MTVILERIESTGTRMSVTIHTKPFGTIQVDSKQILKFPQGLLGFEEFDEYALIEESPESPFKWLQSTKESGLAFIVIQPELFMNDYKPAISDEELHDIGLTGWKEGLIFLIVTIPHDNPKGMTANLQGPIILNGKEGKGKQCISRDENHPIRKNIIESMEEMSSEKV
ncbi:flagellar assembly protein FliW [Leptospira meyeri]|nr:flagellar assembly protein FliW [Leptospira meyeri]PJZ97074.1 flagellar assembly protein FliW [Leptospira meyeri]PKA12190.1 flagellar assembly protein FliW [Leptospira meyeri]PKA25227.1 flagellar assembly protein FliW [Leptospira sp. mixed culture ATI2-C-A1]